MLAVDHHDLTLLFLGWLPLLKVAGISHFRPGAVIPHLHSR
jgi:hypothetical protein